MSFRDKLLTIEKLREWREGLRAQNRTVGVTNGCFDILHLGHVTYLEHAGLEADLLLVGVNGDESVTALKGPGRPLNGEVDRALVLAGLASVGAVCIFPEMRAGNFLRLAAPDVYVKGGDYTMETLDGEEREIVEKAGARIVFIPFVEGRSTSATLQKMSPKG